MRFVGKFQLFTSTCSGFRYLFVDHVKAFAILTGRKPCYQPGSLFKKAKDVVAYLIIGPRG